MSKLPTKPRYWGTTVQLTMTDLRAAPGDAFDAVALGLTIEVTKNGRVVAVISPPNPDKDVDTVFHADGSWTGERPIWLADEALGPGGAG